MVNLSAVNMTEVAVLRAKLKEKEIEVFQGCVMVEYGLH